MKENIVQKTLNMLDLETPDFAKLVGVTPRAVNLWLSSQREIPGPVRAYIRLLLSLPAYLRLQEIEQIIVKRKSKMKPYKYNFILWQLIGACDSGKYDNLSASEVHTRADSGNISSFMLSKFSGNLDFSIIEKPDWEIIDETWARIANAVDARRKFNVDKRGICLLMAYALESMQMLDREAHNGE